jgi:hypothetical protein
MELGVNTATATVAQESNSYKPGFKVGFGGSFDYDNWDLRGEYTWFHGTQNSSAAGTIAPITGIPNTAIPASAALVTQNWNLRMDIGELLLGRWHYVGTKFTIHPNVGVRGAWIRQDNVLTATHTTEQKSTSWAVGPQVGVDSNWMICEGFRLYTNVEADILYTRYTGLSAIVDGVTQVTENGRGAVRTHLDLEMGLGWGTYLDCNNWYFDLTAGYGFQVFFDQNMFRRFSTSTATYYSSSPAGNLYVQGLTLTARVDF